MNKTQVCAATVAYNNPKELTRLLLSLSSQGLALKGLVVIDNSDDSRATENKGVFDTHSKQYPFAQYHKTKSNVGSAGGFRRGMKIANENGFDWVWLLDQDGVVSDLCLTELLNRADSGDILCPKTVDIDRPALVLPMAAMENFFGRSRPVPVTADSCQIDAFGSHGVLISKPLMDSIGYYDACNFFVGLEDYDYARRARRANFAIIAVEAAEARHPDPLRKNAIKQALLAQDTVAPCISQQKATSPKLVHEVAPKDEAKSAVFDRLRPAHLGFIINLSHDEGGSNKIRSLATFSQFYLVTESLKSWQFAIAFTYSCCQLFMSFEKEDEICIKKTLKAYVKCLASNLRKKWPYGCVEEFRRHILE